MGESVEQYVNVSLILDESGNTLQGDVVVTDIEAPNKIYATSIKVSSDKASGENHFFMLVEVFEDYYRDMGTKYDVLGIYPTGVEIALPVSYEMPRGYTFTEWVYNDGYMTWPVSSLVMSDETDECWIYASYEYDLTLNLDDLTYTLTPGVNEYDENPVVDVMVTFEDIDRAYGPTWLSIKAIVQPRGDWKSGVSYTAWPYLSSDGTKAEDFFEVPEGVKAEDLFISSIRVRNYKNQSERHYNDLVLIAPWDSEVVLDDVVVSCGEEYTLPETVELPEEYSNYKFTGWKYWDEQNDCWVENAKTFSTDDAGYSLIYGCMEAVEPTYDNFQFDIVNEVVAGDNTQFDVKITWDGIENCAFEEGKDITLGYFYWNTNNTSVDGSIKCQYDKENKVIVGTGSMPSVCFNKRWYCFDYFYIPLQYGGINIILCCINFINDNFGTITQSIVLAGTVVEFPKEQPSTGIAKFIGWSDHNDDSKEIISEFYVPENALSRWFVANYEEASLDISDAKYTFVTEETADGNLKYTVYVKSAAFEKIVPGADLEAEARFFFENTLDEDNNWGFKLYPDYTNDVLVGSFIISKADAPKWRFIWSIGVRYNHSYSTKYYSVDYEGNHTLASRIDYIPLDISDMHYSVDAEQLSNGDWHYYVKIEFNDLEKVDKRESYVAYARMFNSHIVDGDEAWTIEFEIDEANKCLFADFVISGESSSVDELFYEAEFGYAHQYYCKNFIIDGAEEPCCPYDDGPEVELDLEDIDVKVQREETEGEYIFHISATSEAIRSLNPERPYCAYIRTSKGYNIRNFTYFQTRLMFDESRENLVGEYVVPKDEKMGTFTLCQFILGYADRWFSQDLDVSCEAPFEEIDLDLSNASLEYTTEVSENGDTIVHIIASFDDMTKLADVSGYSVQAWCDNDRRSLGEKEDYFEVNLVLSEDGTSYVADYTIPVGTTIGEIFAWGLYIELPWDEGYYMPFTDVRVRAPWDENVILYRANLPRGTEYVLPETVELPDEYSNYKFKGWYAYLDVEGEDGWYTELFEDLTSVKLTGSFWMDIYGDMEEIPATFTGFKTENGKTYYYINDEKATGWTEIDGATYYFMPSNGAMIKGRYKIISGVGYTFDADGKLAKGGWTHYAKGSRYYWAGEMATGWTTIEGNDYYFDANGYMAKGTIMLDGVAYTFTADGIYVGSDDAYTGFVKTKTGTYYYENGVQVTGWVEVDGQYYYFNPTDNGRMRTQDKIVAGAYYYINADGSSNGIGAITTKKGIKLYRASVQIFNETVEYKGQVYVVDEKGWAKVQ